MSRKILFYLLLILAPFLILEAGTRLALWAYGLWINPFEARQFAQDSVVTRRGVYLRYDFVKGRTGFVAYDRASINPQGFRGEAFEPVKPAGELRIACLGNSVTFGWGVSADSLTYPARLEHRLRTRYPDRAIRVINAGMPRFNSLDILGILLHKVAPLQPDMAIILSGWNDVEDAIAGVPDQTLPAGMYLSGPYVTADRALSWLAERSDFVYLLRKGIAYVMVRLPAGRVTEAQYDDLAEALERTLKTDPYNPEGVATFRRALEATVDACRRYGITPVLLTWPNFFHVALTREEKRVLLGHMLKFPNLSYAGWMRIINACNATIRDVAAREGVLCIDVADIGDYRLFRDAVHPTEEGYDLLSRRVADGLQIDFSK